MTAKKYGFYYIDGDYMKLKIKQRPVLSSNVIKNRLNCSPDGETKQLSSNLIITFLRNVSLAETLIVPSIQCLHGSGEHLTSNDFFFFIYQLSWWLLLD